MTIQIHAKWQHCTIEDFMNLSQDEHRLIYAALEEFHFDIFGKYHNLDESQFNLLKSKILARSEILIDEMPLDNGDTIDV
tara:strand:- start:298 stop:537 length:240 start_codon:yes stop_codon:yes gene_type:complete